MPVVVLNADADSFDQMIANRLEPEIYSLHSLRAFAGAVVHAGESRYPIHIKLDTGMHRLGFMDDEVGALCKALAETPQVKVASVFSHLNCADMHERPRRRFAALPGYPPYGQFGRHRTVPRGAVRHVPPRAGALWLRLPA